MRAGNFSNGVSRSKPWAYAPSSSVRLRIAEPEPGPRPPSKSGRVQSVMILEGSKSYLEPRPLQAGHAAYGGFELKERGAGCGAEEPPTGQGKFLGKIIFFPPTMAA